MKARFIVALIVALSFIGGNVFAAQANGNTGKSGKAKTTTVAHKKHHRHHRVKKTSSKLEGMRKGSTDRAANASAKRK